MKKFISLLLTFMIALSMITAIPFAANAATSNLDPNRVYVQVGDEYFEVKKGDIFEYVFTLEYPDAKIGSLDLRIPYDTDGLDFVPTLDEYGDDDMDAMFPVLGDSVIYNFKRDGEILFNYCHIRGKSFNSSNNVVFKGNFKVTADKGVYAINGYLYTLADKDVNKIVIKGETIIEHTCAQDIPKLTPVDPNTEPPTGESSEEIETEEITDIPSSDIPTDPSTEPDEEETDDETEEKTEEPTLHPTDNDEKVYVKIDGVYYEAQQGDVFTYQYCVSVEGERKISTYEASVYYDAQGLTFVPALDEYGDEDYAEIFPIFGEKTFANFDLIGEIRYNYSDVRGKVLDAGSVIFSGQFEVTAKSGVYEISTYLSNMGDSDSLLLVYRGEKYDDFEQSEACPDLVVAEDKTDPPTVEPTENKITVYFVDSDNMNYDNLTVFVSAYDGEKDEWVRTPIVKTALVAPNGGIVYKAYLEAGYEKIYFVISGYGKTEDTEPKANQYYCNAAEKWYEKLSDIPVELPTQPSTEQPTEPLEPTETPSAQPRYITFYLFNSANWSSQFAFPMIDVEDTDAVWPGEEMDYVIHVTEDDDVYKVTIDSKYKYVVFNSPIDEIETDTIEIQPNRYYDNKKGEWVDYKDLRPVVPTEASSIEPTEEPTEEKTEAPTTRPDESITVYLINSKDWTYQNIYLWNDGDSIATWPGLAMIYTGQTASNGAPIFKFTCEKHYANVIFNSGVGGEQTADLLLENGKYYDNLTDQWYDTPDMDEYPVDPPTIPSETPTDPPATPDEPEIEPTEEESTEIIEPTESPSEDESTEPSEEPTEKPTEQIKVYLIDKAGWGGGHVYAWNENGEQHNPWPGSTMTFEGAFGDYDVFSYTFDEAYDYIIFNNGADGEQTDNLDFVINGVFNNKTMEWEVVPDDPSENPSEDPIEPSEKPSEDPNPSEGEEEKLMGDINGDGKITVFDATLLQRFIAKMDELTEEQLRICDMDNDGQIKVFDATILQRIVAKQD